jgi:hypothetical protein
MIHPQKGYASVNKTDSVLINSITDSVFITIEKAVFSRTDELFYIGIDNNSLVFNYEVVKAIQDDSSKYVGKMHPTKKSS